MSAPIAEYTLEALTTKGLGGKEPNMLIIGCDYHPGFQQIACVDTDGGELSERRFGAFRRFYSFAVWCRNQRSPCLNLKEVFPSFRHAGYRHLAFAAQNER